LYWSLSEPKSAWWLKFRITLQRHVEGIENMMTVVSAYSDAPIFQRALVAARPFICPFDPIITMIPPNKEVLDVG
jgi:hypothetical protein